MLCCHAARKALEGTVEQLLESAVRPFTIGHRGSGERLGEDPSRPIENTVPAVRAGFRAGLPVVEVDVQLTRDGQLAVFHEVDQPYHRVPRAVGASSGPSSPPTVPDGRRGFGPLRGRDPPSPWR
jgi:glycerophosphoryl diester phosphodiesterase